MTHRFALLALHESVEFGTPLFITPCDAWKDIDGVGTVTGSDTLTVLVVWVLFPALSYTYTVIVYTPALGYAYEWA